MAQAPEAVRLKGIVRRYRDRLAGIVARATVPTLVLDRSDIIRTLAADARDLMAEMTEALGVGARNRRIGRLVTPHVAKAVASLRRVERKLAQAGQGPRAINAAVRDLLRGSVVAVTHSRLARLGVTLADTAGLRALGSSLRRILIDQGMEAIKSALVVELLGKGYVSAEWTLSPAHSVKDACDDLAGRRFPLLAWPARPHPHCGCLPGRPSTDPAPA
jgi:hypothetical protein